jgi:hypothetical protein
MDRTPSEVGAEAELEVSRALLAAGWDIYVPLFAAHSRVDVLAVRSGQTLRVQCKTARLLGSILYFRTCSNTKNRPRPYHGEIDPFGVYSPDLKLALLVPIDGLGDQACSLRLDPPANNQSRGVRYAADYLIRRAANSAVES